MTRPAQLARTAAALACCCLAAPHAAGQDAPPITLPDTADAPRFDELTTPDGTRFLLVRDEGAPVVQWVVLTPAGPAEEPLGAEGVSYAAARASLSGTSTTGSADWTVERAALAALDDVDRRIAHARANGEGIDDELLAERARTRAAAQRASDPTAWRRRLADAPAGDVRVVEAGDSTMLALTTTAGGVPGVARLLWERREDAQLRGLESHVEQLRRELVLRGAGPSATLRSEVLGLAFLGDAGHRSLQPVDRTIPREVALRVYRATQRPERSYHVLLGNFDLGEVAAVLRRVFATTDLPPFARLPRATASRGRERRTTIPGAARQAVGVAVPLPDNADRDALDVFAEWLAGGDDSFLAEQLRAGGLPGFTVQAIAPFPTNASGGLLLVEVWQRETPREDAPELPLADEVLAVLRRAAPAVTEQRLAEAVARVRAARVARQRSPRDRAIQLALECGARGRAPAAVLADPTSALRNVTLPLVRRLAEAVLQQPDRTVVVLERGQ